MPKKKKTEKKYIARRVFLFLILIVVIGFAGWYIGSSLLPSVLGGNDDVTDDTSQSMPDDEPSASVPETDPEAEDQLPETVDDDWSLILVNTESPLPDDFAVDLVTVYEIETRIFQVDSRIEEPFQQMLLAARLDGVSIFPTSAYRAVDYQVGLYQNKIQEYLDYGYDEEEAIATAGTIVAVPGTSEHHTGLAVDLITDEYQELDEGFEDTPAFRWLDQHAHEYGFVLRFPKNKQEITGIIYEPWHYRYVGVEHAALMKETGLCLEEYVELRAQVQTAALSGEDAESGESGEDLEADDTQSVE